ncbi:hypothetical protein SCFA_2740002 [anaerobic digester metagenome]|uniref:Uncharacterized protein n=1 Tax=anaerobic digester metagenome TaxID=1263854 RepID=A0A485M6E3_9ZZZZ
MANSIQQYLLNTFINKTPNTKGQGLSLSLCIFSITQNYPLTIKNGNKKNYRDTSIV